MTVLDADPKFVRVAQTHLPGLDLSIDQEIVDDYLVRWVEILKPTILSDGRTDLRATASSGLSSNTDGLEAIIRVVVFLAGVVAHNEAIMSVASRIYVAFVVAFIFDWLLLPPGLGPPYGR